MADTSAPVNIIDNYVRSLPSFIQGPLIGLHWLLAQASTVFIFISIAAWPFFPVLIQSRPWPLPVSFLFVILVCLLAGILTCRSGCSESAVLASGLTLLLTGMVAVQYTNSQTKFL